MKNCGCRAAPPAIISPRWETYSYGEFTAAWQRTPSGLTVTLAYETYCADHPHDDNPDMAGTFVRVVISRPNRYPTWEEMRDYLELLPYIDHSRDCFMLLPPRKHYVNVASYAMHWFQRIPQ